MIEEIEQMLERYPLVWSAHDVDTVLDFFTDDCIYEDIPLKIKKEGKQGIIDFAKEIFSMQHDFHIEYHRHFATEEKGAAEWMIKTTWNGEFANVDVTGKKVEFPGVTLFEFQDGKIRRNTDYWDLADVMKQLGVLSE